MSTEAFCPTIAVIGSHDFIRRTQGALVGEQESPWRACSAHFAEAWPLIVSEKPDMVVIETTPAPAIAATGALRRLCSQVHERFGSALPVIAVIGAPEQSFYAGDLLFASSSGSEPSMWLATFVAVPPGNMPAVPSLSAQIRHAVLCTRRELLRRAEGKPALPALGAADWAQSFADFESRELWLQWLPRYAGYTDENPVIVGETGTGKTSLARALHTLSGRKGEFVSITPRDFSSSELVQAELFGAVAGAYTGAVDRWGLVKRAEGGTLFMDELQSIDKDLQGKIITFIENKVYRRVGSTDTVQADVRFVFASNRSLHDMMTSGTLRDDFAYRLERVQLQLKPLRERRLDIASALSRALAKVARQRPHAQRVHGFSAGAWRMMFAQNWPGNLRQLENAVAQLCELCDMEQCSLIEERHVVSLFSARLQSSTDSVSQVLGEALLSVSADVAAGGCTSLADSRTLLNARARNLALNACGGDIAAAAALIGDDADDMRLYAKSACAHKEAK